jgi:phosphohistidine swiveling domain-containing protein
MKKKIDLIFTRDFSLCSGDFWHILLSQELKREFNFSIDRQIMRFNGRALESYRERDEMDRFKKHFLSNTLDNEIYSKKSVDSFKKNIDAIVRLMEKVGKNLDKDQIKNFNESSRLFRLIYPWIAFSNFLPGYWREDFIKKYGAEAEKIADRWYIARVFSEGKFEMINAYWTRLSGKLLEENGINGKYKRLVRFKELEKLINGKNQLTEKELKKRAGGYILFRGKLMAGKDFSEFLNEHKYEYDGLKINKKIKELKGQVASQGKIIRGKIQLILNETEVRDFQEGNILVTTMTVPDFLPAMKKAAAIVTDEGGITCHAAIVSRELKKPCVIGTKIATKVFKDGDMVEVDANGGIIKIIKRQSNQN